MKMKTYKVFINELNGSHDKELFINKLLKVDNSDHTLFMKYVQYFYNERNKQYINNSFCKHFILDVINIKPDIYQFLTKKDRTFLNRNKKWIDDCFFNINEEDSILFIKSIILNINKSYPYAYYLTRHMDYIVDQISNQELNDLVMKNPYDFFSRLPSFSETSFESLIRVFIKNEITGNMQRMDNKSKNKILTAML